MTVVTTNPVTMGVVGTTEVLASGAVALDGWTLTTGSLVNTSGGTFNHRDGTLTVRGGTYAPGTTALTLNGNTPTALPHLVLDGATPAATFWNVLIGDNARGALTVSGGTALENNGNSSIGSDAGSTGEVTVDGNTSAWGVGGALIVAHSGTGTMSVTGGGQISSGYGYVGWAAGSTGDVTVDGNGSLWTTTESLYVGGSDSAAGGTGAVTVSSDGHVGVGGALKVWETGTLTVDGGTVTAGGLAGSAGAAVALRDPAGGTALTVGSAASAEFLGDLRNIPGGSGSLRKVGTGTQTLGGVNSWTGTTGIDEGVLALPYGLGTPGATVTVAAGAELRTAGVVNRPLAGEGTVTATDWLVAGDGGSPTGWAFPGTLSVGPHSALLLDADVAELGALTTLAAGGRLNSFAGARLGPDGSADPTKVLGASGSAVVDGVFTNNGLVNGPTDPGQWLTFEDDVDALGTFTGNIRFKGDYTVGMGAAAFAAATCFEGSTVLVGEGCGLDLDGPTTFERVVTKTGAGCLTVDGPQAHGTDALLAILAGTVWLNTDAGGAGGDFSISVTGAELNFGCNQHLDTLALFDEAVVRFAGANVVVVKHLVMDGVDLGAMTLTPEPASAALMVVGLALLARRSRRLRSR